MTDRTAVACETVVLFAVAVWLAVQWFIRLQDRHARSTQRKGAEVMTPAEARQVACLLVIQQIEPLESPSYAALGDEEARLVDREIREIKTWLRLRSGAYRAAKPEREGGQ